MVSKLLKMEIKILYVTSPRTKKNKKKKNLGIKMVND